MTSSCSAPRSYCLTNMYVASRTQCQTLAGCRLPEPSSAPGKIVYSFLFTVSCPESICWRVMGVGWDSYANCVGCRARSLSSFAVFSYTHEIDSESWIKFFKVSWILCFKSKLRSRQRWSSSRPVTEIDVFSLQPAIQGWSSVHPLFGGSRTTCELT